jgi:glycosyltransferase involved in cell wall biosynthesis
MTAMSPLLRVGLESSITHFTKLGSAIYSAQLSQAIISTTAKVHALKLNIPRHFTSYHSGFLRKLYAAYWQLVHAHIAIPIQMRLIKGELLHYTNIMPISSRLQCPVVATITDLIPLLHPEWWPHKGINNQRMINNIHSMVKRADHIIAISKSTQRDIVEYFGIPQSKVSVTYLGAGLQLPIISINYARDHIKSTYQLEPGYILCVGSQAPNKNMNLVIEALQILKQKATLNSPSGLPRLVIVGKQLSSQARLKQKIDQYGLAQQITFTGHVTNESLAALYGSAGVLAYPSFYEGFGLVLLEAMSCGCPVITSNTSSLPEVVGNAAIKVDPNQPIELASAIQRVLDDEGLANSLRDKGFARASEFSWTKCADETIEIYRRVAGQG